MYDKFNKYRVFFIDDEIPATETFNEYFENTFKIFTANHIDEAKTILDNNKAEIGIILCDYNLSEDKTGLDFLKQCASDYPNIVRILTTAFSNHDLAIEAVNSGILYKYILKPWDYDLLSQTLIRAADYFIIKKERNYLAKENVSILQQIVFTDRFRCLLMLSEGINIYIKNSLLALKKFMAIIPDDSFSRDTSNYSLSGNIWYKAKQKNNALLELIEDVKQTVFINNFDSEFFSLNKLFQQETKKAIDKYGIKFNVTINPNFPDCYMNINLLVNAIGKLIKYIAETEPDQISIKSLNIIDFHETKGTEITFQFNATREKEKVWNLLPIFFAIYHHYGKIKTGKNKISIFMPFNYKKASVENVQLDNTLLNDFFEHFEVIKSYELWLSAIKKNYSPDI